MKANYGLDAPEIVRRYGLYGCFSLIASLALSLLLPPGWILDIALTIALCVTIGFLIPVITIPFGSLVLKFKDRDWLFRHLALKGDEKVLDVGCGHGLLLIGAAKQLTSGRVLGLDRWVQDDQANNSKEATLRNGEIEGVADKIEVKDGDMRSMPFADGSFDALISSWAIHNIYDRAEREKALAEVIRVLKPGGRLAILDIDHAPAYRDYFVRHGMQNVQLRGPRFTFGNRTYLVLATKP